MSKFVVAGWRKSTQEETEGFLSFWSERRGRHGSQSVSVDYMRCALSLFSLACHRERFEYVKFAYYSCSFPRVFIPDLTTAA